MLAPYLGTNGGISRFYIEKQEEKSYFGSKKWVRKDQMERQENGVERNKFVASIKMQSNFSHYNYKSDFILNKLTKKRYQTQIDT